MEMLFEEKEKKTCFFQWMRDLDEKSFDFFIRLPKAEWIPFKSIPSDIFPIIFNIIDRSSNIAVDRDMTEFLILDKRKFPNRLRESSGKNV